MLGPYNEHDVGTRMQTFRNCVPVPFRYMHFFMQGPLLVRQGIEIVGASIVASGDRTNCSLLLNSLCMACTLADPADTASELRIPIPVAIAPDADLMRRRLDVVDYKLPHRMAAPAPVASAGVQISQAIGDLVQEQRDARQEARDRQQTQQTKTVDDFYGDKITEVLRVCQVATSAQLPDLHHRLAANGRKRTRTTIQSALDAEMACRHWTMSFVVTPSIANKVQDFMVRGDLLGNNLSRGFHQLMIQVLDPSDNETVNKNTTFLLQDVVVYLGNIPHPAATVPLDLIHKKKVRKK